MPARPVPTFLQGKIRFESVPQKEMLTRAAAADRRSLNAYLLIAAVERAERQGFKIEEEKPEKPAPRARKSGR